jgi:alpha-tubulin suppressor-like RCC1 family protein
MSNIVKIASNDTIDLISLTADGHVDGIDTVSNIVDMIAFSHYIVALTADGLVYRHNHRIPIDGVIGISHIESMLILLKSDNTVYLYREDDTYIDITPNNDGKISQVVASKEECCYLFDDGSATICTLSRLIDQVHRDWMYLSCFDNILQIACGDHHTLILTADGRVYGKGDNIYNQLGIIHMMSIDYALIPIPEKIAYIYARKNRSLFLTVDGKVYGCGNNIEKHPRNASIVSAFSEIIVSGIMGREIGPSLIHAEDPIHLMCSDNNGDWLF